MKEEELDRILSAEREILPSPGFAASVMRAVREEACAPPPIPFPWKRLLPGLVVSLVGVGALLAQVAQHGHGGVGAEPASMFVPMLFVPMFETAQRLGLQWIMVAGVITLAALWFPLRQMGDEGLTN
jgi:hypothetical protein